MPESAVAIVTEWDGPYGTGHIQRMASLIWYLNTAAGTGAVLYNHRAPGFFTEEMRPYVQPDLTSPPSLILRDMRDSSSDEISRLKRISPVLAIDDLGEGRGIADFSLDLLPNPGVPASDNNDRLFIYGYTFLRTIEKLRSKKYEKYIDYALYPGADAPEEYIRLLLSLLPAGASHALFAGRNSFIEHKDKRTAINQSEYASILLSSKVLISHFGIMLYEARLAGCRIVTIHPTEYHSMLADIAPARLEITNLGISENLRMDSARETLRGISQKENTVEPVAGEIYASMLENLDRFNQYLKSIML